MQIVGYSIGAAGFHDVDQPTGQPYAVVSVQGYSTPVDPAYWSVSFSHEILEMLVDPTVSRYVDGGLLEVCDPVQDQMYTVDSVDVSNFVTPAYFVVGSRGPWDAEHTLLGPLMGETPNPTIRANLTPTATRIASARAR